MKKTIKVNMDKGYTFEEVINDRVDCGAKWAELGWFDGALENYLSGNFYYLSSYYGSEGGFYNEDTDQLIPSWDIDDMTSEDFINTYGMDKETVQNNCEFVEFPIDREVSGLRVDYEHHLYGNKCGEEMIWDDKDMNYKDGCGIYKYIDGLFYKVELEANNA